MWNPCAASQPSVPEKGALGIGFHAFGDHAQAERTAEPNDGAHDRLGIGAVPEPGDEGAVDLDLVDRKLAQPAPGWNSRFRSRRSTPARPACAVGTDRRGDRCPG